tara:strand:- start:192 stop:341 length:150 start_codon:yes stop_codon:yes gene_type:complete
MTRNATSTLNNANDSVTLINQINDGDFSYFMEGYTTAIVTGKQYITDNS